MTLLRTRTEPDADYGRCHCGRHADKYSSGTPECWLCWNYRKLDRPAALHWAKVLAEVWSNIDLYDDMTFFPDAGTTGSTLNDLLPLLVRSKLLVQHGPEHIWPDALWNALCRDDWYQLAWKDSLATR